MKAQVFPSIISKAFLFLSLYTFTASAANYYVAVTGNDNNTGTVAKPFRTIAKASAIAKAGDTVHIKGGTYRERLIPRNSGQSGKYITFRNYKNEVVQIDGSFLPPGFKGGLVSIAKKSFIKLQGLQAINAEGSRKNQCFKVAKSDNIILDGVLAKNCWSSGFLAKDSKNITITKSELINTAYQGNILNKKNIPSSEYTYAVNECLSSIRTDGVEVSHNHIHNCGKESIDLKQGTKNAKVFGNHIHHGRSFGIYLDGYRDGLSNIEVYNNFIHDLRSTGIQIAHERGGTVEKIHIYNNVATRCKKCFRLSNWSKESDLKMQLMNDIKYVNNTCYKNGNAGISVNHINAHNVVIQNNILSQNGYSQLSIKPKAIVNVTIDHNLIDGVQKGPHSVVGKNAILEDPEFLSVNQDDFALNSGSPAIDAGSRAFTPPIDFIGEYRPKGKAPDIGAFEYVTKDSKALLHPNGFKVINHKR